MRQHNHGFWARFVKLNGPLLSSFLRELAHQVDVLMPGPAKVASPVCFINDREVLMSEITVKDSSAPLGATVTFIDAKGAPTSPDDAPQWSSSDETVATVEASEDGLSASVAIGLPGATVVKVSSTDTDGTVIESTGTVTVEPGEAAFGDVEFTAPE